MQTIILVFYFITVAFAYETAFPVGPDKKHQSNLFLVVADEYYNGTHLGINIDNQLSDFFNETEHGWVCGCCVHTDTVFNHIPGSSHINETLYNTIPAAWFFREKEKSIYKAWKKDLFVHIDHNYTVYDDHVHKKRWKTSKLLDESDAVENFEDIVLITGKKACDDGISILIPKEKVSDEKALELQNYLLNYYS